MPLGWQITAGYDFWGWRNYLRGEELKAFTLFCGAGGNQLPLRRPSRRARDLLVRAAAG